MKVLQVRRDDVQRYANAQCKGDYEVGKEKLALSHNALIVVREATSPRKVKR